MVEFNPIAARNGGYDFVANALDDRTRTRAGRQYAGGDVTGASGTLASGGLIADGMSLERQQAAIAEAERRAAAAEREEDSKWLVQAATGLRAVPYDQRKAVYQSRIRPLLQQNGFDDDELAQVDAADYTDSELDALLGALGGEIVAPYANDRAGPNGSVLRPDRYTGEYTPAYTAPFDPRMGAPAGYMWTDETRTRQIPIPGGSADPTQAGALAASRRAPARGRSSGGGSSGSSRSSGARVSSSSGNPWDKDY